MDGRAGWYDDPWGGGGLRFFDGAAWTQHTRPQPPDDPVGSLAPGALSRRRRRALVGAAAVVAVSLVLLLTDDVVGRLGPAATLLIIAGTLLFALAVGVLLVARRHRAVRAARAAGALREALWATGVQLTDPTGGRLPAVGVLALTPWELRFEPARAGVAPLVVPLDGVAGVETMFGLADRFGGGYLYVGLRDGRLVEFVGDGRGLVEVCRRLRVPVAGS